MAAVPLDWYLILAGFLFAIGTVGVLVSRNAIVILMAVELMLNAVNLTFVAFSHFLGKNDGQVMVFLVMTVAAAEAAVGLAIILNIFRTRESVNIDDIYLMKW